MDKNIKIKNILFYTFSILIVLIIIDVKFHPFEKINYTPIKKGIEIVRQTQTIAPARVYINVWRIAKSEYADKSMNNQDWKRWRNRYNNKIKTMEDCEVAVNTMLSSLNDPYTRFLKSTNYKRQKVIMESKIRTKRPYITSIPQLGGLSYEKIYFSSRRFSGPEPEPLHRPPRPGCPR